jgi:two-component system response regulator RegA
MSTTPSLLIVDDDDRFRARLAAAIAARGYDVRQAATLMDARALLADDPPEFVVLDLKLGEGYGLDLIEACHAADPNTRIVVLTGYGSIATAMDAVRRGATHYLTKPADADQILAAFDHGGPATSEASARPMSLDRVEWEHINRVLVDCGGNVSEAARLLGLHRRSLQRKLAKFPRPEST